jgi:hypothetical protein
MNLKSPLLFRRCAIFAAGLSILTACVWLGAHTNAQQPDAATPQVKPTPQPKATPQLPKPLPQDPKNYTAEQIAEGVIAVAGNGYGRLILNQIRRNGIERGRITRINEEGRAEETRYEMRFVRGDKAGKDKVRLDTKSPQAEYTLISSEGRMFGIINGSTFTPRADAKENFISQQAHSIDALLRYKENESKVASAGKDKHQGIDLYVLDLTDKADRHTRFFISAKTFRVLWLEYEETPPGSSTAVKYTKHFYDYRLAQATQLPFRTVQLEDGKQTLETRILTVTFGVKMEDALFQNPDAPTTAGNP